MRAIISRFQNFKRSLESYCYLEGGHLHFGGTCCFHFKEALRMQAPEPHKTEVVFSPTLTSETF
jgi:hypothetical protein